MTVQPIEALGRVPLLAGVEYADLERLAVRLKEHTFEAGETLTVEGQRGVRVLAFFLILDGTVSVTKGGEQVATLGPGDYFGEIALLHDVPRTATVTAETDLRCLALSAWDFRAFVEEHPNVTWALFETIAERLDEA